MVQMVIEGRAGARQSEGGFGWLSFHYQMGGEVIDTSSTGFTLYQPPLFGTVDPDPSLYTGTDLVFTDITLFGTTLATPSSGTITGGSHDGASFSTTITGMDVDAADFYRVSGTKGNADNVALLKQTFSGADSFLGGRLKDKFNGFHGNDEIDGRRGSDRLWGGKGQDTLMGGNGNDRLIGGSGKDNLQGGSGKDKLRGGSGADELRGGKGNDTLEGGSGNDYLNGGLGNDILEGGKGNDRLISGAGEDVFVFNGDYLGKDTIENLNLAEDRIEISHPHVRSFYDLTLATVGSNTEIHYYNTIIVLENTDIADVDSSLFLF